MIHIRNLTILLIVFATLLSLGWVGYLASDDSLYATAAQNWMNAPPFVGDNHWALRQPFVLSISLSFALFGAGEMSLSLVSAAYFVLLLMFTYAVLARTFSPAQALLSGLLLASTPLYITHSSFASVDIPELFFVAASLFLFVHALKDPTQNVPLVAAGVLAGFGWLMRETSVGLLLLYVSLFAAAWPLPRARMLWVAAGSAAVLLLEWLFYWITIGNPLHRLMVDLRLTGDKSAVTTSLVDWSNRSNAIGSGNVKLTEWLDPLLVLFVNQEFGLLFIMALPAGIWAWRHDGWNTLQRQMVRLLVLLPVVWFIFVGYLVTLSDQPRYFSVSAFAAVILVALWLYHLASRWRKTAWLLGAALVGVAALGLYIENKDPIFEERMLIKNLQSTDEVIHTDRFTLGRADFFIETLNIPRERVSIETPPPVGALVFLNQKRVMTARAHKDYKERYRPRDHWREVGRIKPERMLTGYLLEWLGLDKRLPQGLVSRLNSPNMDVILYRVMPR